VSNDDSFAMARRLAKGGRHPGRHLDGRQRRGRHRSGQAPREQGKMIVTIACSTGERYLSTPLAAEAKAEVGG